MYEKDYDGRDLKFFPILLSNIKLISHFESENSSYKSYTICLHWK